MTRKPAHLDNVWQVHGDRRIRRLDVAKRFSLARPVAQPVAAFGTVHTDRAHDALAVREEHRDHASRGHAVARIERGLVIGNRREDHVRSMIEDRASALIAVNLEWEKAGL
jgi:hypothetical protein